MSIPKFRTLPCEVCFLPAECPVLSYYDPEKMRVIRMCSKRCLDERKELEEFYAKYKSNYLQMRKSLEKK